MNQITCKDSNGNILATAPVSGYKPESRRAERYFRNEADRLRQQYPTMAKAVVQNPGLPDLVIHY